jgi:hypothetical protein
MDIESMVEENSTELSVVARITSAPEAISSFARWVAQGPFPITNVFLFKIVTLSKFDFPLKYKRQNRLSTETFFTNSQIFSKYKPLLNGGTFTFSLHITNPDATIFYRTSCPKQIDTGTVLLKEEFFYESFNSLVDHSF